MRCVNTWTDGTITEDWVIGSVLLSQDPKEPGIHLYNPKIDLRYHDFGSGDFGMLDWITAKAYDRVVKHGDEVCYQFTAKTIVKASQDSGPHNQTLAQQNAPTSPTSVFISVQSGLPMEIDNDDGKYVFHYLSTPTDELKLPAPFLNLIKAYRQH